MKTVKVGMVTLVVSLMVLPLGLGKTSLAFADEVAAQKTNEVIPATDPDGSRQAAMAAHVNALNSMPEGPQGNSAVPVASSDDTVVVDPQTENEETTITDATASDEVVDPQTENEVYMDTGGPAVKFKDSIFKADDGKYYNKETGLKSHPITDRNGNAITFTDGDFHWDKHYG